MSNKHCSFSWHRNIISNALSRGIQRAPLKGDAMAGACKGDAKSKLYRLYSMPAKRKLCDRQSASLPAPNNSQPAQTTASRLTKQMPAGS